MFSTKSLDETNNRTHFTAQTGKNNVVVSIESTQCGAWVMVGTERWGQAVQVVSAWNASWLTKSPDKAWPLTSLLSVSPQLTRVYLSEAQPSLLNLGGPSPNCTWFFTNERAESPVLIVTSVLIICLVNLDVTAGVWTSKHLLSLNII